MTHQIELFPNGKNSVKHSILGESMHSSIGPWEEANLIYVGQSRLEESFENLDSTPLVVYDLGLGIAANALALIATYEKLSRQSRADSTTRTPPTKTRDLHLISFENDLKGLEFAFNHEEAFPFLQGNSELSCLLITLMKQTFLAPPFAPFEAPRTILLKSRLGFEIRWDLRLGDFRQEIKQMLPPPELIYFDFYSPKSSPALWCFKIFKRLYELTLPRRAARLPTSLLTYTASTSVRSALILAGFNVGYGVQTFAKFETTIATTNKEALTSPLGHEWLEHLKRSSKPVPSDHGYDSLNEAIFNIIKTF